ncbi:ion transporter [Larsenimonas salina]|uniref:ion transporter n=1 Tax=Larsenimonas salina TaxID=1295565 RepID=UPI002072BFB8|nr:ion transporter [Larsenimonas salina]MCM5705028.1 ion transporter [Larsenimonas salina]
MATTTSQRDRLHAWWDTFIIVVVALNLLLILFDSLYGLAPVASLIDSGPAWLAENARYLHQNFVTIDLYFVAFLILDVLAGWLVAIRERRYHRWFFYPFIHWYDVLGCIPVSGFRLLRVLRVIGLAVRLQRMGAIDIRQWPIYNFVHKYYQILMEELSDRVAVKLLTNVQYELTNNGELVERITNDVLLPRKDALVDDLADRASRLILTSYGKHRDDILEAVDSVIAGSVSTNPDIAKLRQLPMGDQIAKGLERSLAQALIGLIDSGVRQINQTGSRTLAKELLSSGFDAWIEDSTHANREVEQVMVEVIEVIKHQIQTQQWKFEYGVGTHDNDRDQRNPK